MTLLESFPFTFNKDETDNALRFPDLSISAYIFSISIGTDIYSVQVTWNTWLNSPMVSIYTQDNEPIQINTTLAPRITDLSPNYLNDVLFKGYSLFWEPAAAAFTFYQDS